MTNSQPTKLSAKSNCTKIIESQCKQQKFLRRIMAVSFAVQAVLIGVRGNLDVLSGKPVLDVIPWMMTQGIELIIKAQDAEKRSEKRDRKSHSDKQ
jgi:hypothetical protein